MDKFGIEGQTPHPPGPVNEIVSVAEQFVAALVTVTV
jgi:hypothetical protein